tara:strand:+ start:128 stop:391 length:264 start_codon:yes stop_codon:yes gene_type:complete
MTTITRFIRFLSTSPLKSANKPVITHVYSEGYLKMKKHNDNYLETYRILREEKLRQEIVLENIKRDKLISDLSNKLEEMSKKIKHII